MLQKPFQRAGAVNRVIPTVNDLLFRRIGCRKKQLFIVQAFLQVRQKQIHNPSCLGFGQRLVEYNFIQPVQELGPELLLEQGINVLPRLLGDLPVLVDTVQNIGRTEV